MAYGSADQNDPAKLVWERMKYLTEIDGRRARVLYVASFSTRYDSNPRALLFRYDDDPAIWAIRWEVGVAMNLDTEDAEQAREAIEAMYKMEGQING